MAADERGDGLGGGTRLRARALLLGLPLVVLLSFVTVYGDMVVQKIQIGILQLAPPAVGGLLLVVGLTRLLRWATRRKVLGAQDLLPLYVMMTIAVLMSSRGTVEKLVPTLIGLNYYATPENQWMELFGDYLPEWLVAFDPEGPPRQAIAVDYHEGNATVEWRFWLGPLLSWSGLLAFVYITFLCLAVILRRQWAEHEKLVFPLTTLPLTVIDERVAAPFFRDRLTWLGFLIPVAVYLVNGLHANIAAVPEIPLRQILNRHLHTRPWNAIPYTPLTVSFAAIGFFYFLANDLLLSLWLFFVLTRVTDVIGTQLGYELARMPRHPPRMYVGYQTIGAYLVLVIYLLRTGWPHFRSLLAGALPRRRCETPDDADEMLPYPVAVWGVVLGFLGSVAWCYYAGLDAWLAVVQMGVYLFVIAVVMARGVAEAGLLQTETTFRTTDILKVFMPQTRLGPRNLTLLALLDTVLARDLRGVLLSNFLDDQKMARELRFPERSLVLPIGFAVVTTLAVGCYFFITLSHDVGHITMYTYPHNNINGQIRDAAAAIQTPTRTPAVAGLSLLVGIAVCTLLVALRTTLVWWPLHPLGYAMSGSWTMIVFWFSAFLTWLLKGFILRSGGMKTYRRFMPFFLGLTLGSFTMAFLWTAVVFTGQLHGLEIQAPRFGFD